MGCCRELQVHGSVQVWTGDGVENGEDSDFQCVCWEFRKFVIPLLPLNGGMDLVMGAHSGCCIGSSWREVL